MKRLLKTALMTMVFAVLLCVGALAAESGIYDLRSEAEGVTVEAWSAGSAPDYVGAKVDGVTTTITVTEEGKTEETKSVTFHPGAVKVKLTYSPVESGKQYLVFALNNDAGVPQDGNIAYIDQNGEAVFTVYPGSLEHGKTYSIYVSSNSEALPKTLVATFKYYQDGMLGDVYIDKIVDVFDLQAMCNYLAGNLELNSAAMKNADVFEPSTPPTVDVFDLQKLCNYLAGNTDL